MSSPTAPASSPPTSAHAPSGPHPATSTTTGTLAQALGGTLEGSPDLVITNLGGLDEATPGTLTFVRSAKFAKAWAGSKATAVLATRDIPLGGHDPATRAIIRVDDADLAMIKVLSMFSPKWHQPDPGVHPTAIIDPTATVAPSARIGAHSTVGPHCRIADHVVLHPGVTLGAHVAIGPGSVLHAGVVVYDRCTIGAQSILHANVTIGADGFGYRPDPAGRGLIKIPHIGTVQIGNAVEVGANSCIDRGKFGATVIGDGTKIDNLVQIGHNVRIGRACVICGVTGIGGSTVIGDGCIIAGHVGIADGIHIGARATISAKSGVISDVPTGEVHFGSPAGPHKEQMRAYAIMRRLPEIYRDIDELKRAARRAGWVDQRPGHD
ncbi:MAG TPA: UDP-3-O-(3-hydroxymyristoyl)glucosamine N-acyltransferase [Phycisphaerales bacterium]|nr:UDP-3-O-(3-hydroxymyristoyl)glucosamine N-acyltransferase [Phycisphaerales bacterium]